MVSMNKIGYKNEILFQLSNRTVYLPLDHNPPRDLHLKICELFIGGTKSDKLIKCLIPMYLKVPILHTVPKVHKNMRNQQDDQSPLA